MSAIGPHSGVEAVILPNELVKIALSNSWVGFGFFCFLIAWAFIIVWRVQVRLHKPLMQALAPRLEVLEIVGSAPTRIEAQTHFFKEFDNIDAVMREGGSNSRAGLGLRHAWMEFTETILDNDAKQYPLQISTRPDGYFRHLGDDTKVLSWWANLFVAIGLTVTFLGIIAALTGAVEGMSSQAAGGGDMTGPLITLLVITSGKFWSSIGGVLGSIVLRSFDRTWHGQSLRALELLSDRIEAGTQYVSTQQLAALQLQAIKQQAAAMSSFSTQLATSIGKALEEQISPVVQGLTSIQSSLDDFKSGSFDAIGAEFGKALKDNAGAEMTQLASALTQMTQGIQGVNEKLDGTSQVASDQIAAAAKEFSAASTSMTTAFTFLSEKIEAIGDSLSKQTTQAEERYKTRTEEDSAQYGQIIENQKNVIDGATQSLVSAVQNAIDSAMGRQNGILQDALANFAQASTGIHSSFDVIKEQFKQMGTLLTEQGSATASTNADILARAAQALENSLNLTQTGMDEALRNAIAKSASISQDALTQAFASFGEAFEDASSELVRTLTTSTGRLEMAGEAFERSSVAVGDHADKISAAGREAAQTGSILKGAATDLAVAAGPVREATASINEALGTTRAAIERTSATIEKQHAALSDVTAAFAKTTGSAAQAWEGYRQRFEQVDEALAKALGQIASASAQHSEAINQQVGRVDKGLADAVDRLGTALDDIRDLAAALEDLRSQAA